MSASEDPDVAAQHGTLDTPVTVALTRAAGSVTLSVLNQGSPIPEHALRRLFQPFFRGSGGEPQAGLGLGLYIVSEIVKSHGGPIDVRSSRDEGTRFVCTFPVTI